MKKDLTELVFILDKSGSMSGLEKDTIGGFNSFLVKQREVEGEVIISTVLFDTTSRVIHDRIAINEISDMTDKDYTVGGCTALLDAIGRSIKHINRVQKALPEEERPEKTMFIITTDGQENSSREYDFAKIKKMIEKKKAKKNWEFLFLGANIDAIGTAASIGIAADRAVNYKCDAVGTATNYNALSKVVGRYRMCPAGAENMALDGWDQEIKEDFEERQGKAQSNSSKGIKKKGFFGK